MNQLHIVLIETTSYWHLSVWKKKLFFPFLIEEKKYDKSDYEQTVKTVFHDLQNKYAPLTKNISFVACLDPKNVIVKEWQFPFSSKTKIKRAINIMLEVEMPQADLLTHAVIINPKDKENKNTTVYTLSCLTSFLKMWYSLLEQYNVSQTKITFLPFPYLAGQKHTEEKNYLGLFKNTVFSISYKKNQIKKINQIQFFQNAQNDKYILASLKLVLPPEKTEFILINNENQRLKNIAGENSHPYIADPILKNFFDRIVKSKFIKADLKARQQFDSIENTVAYNTLLSPFSKVLPFFTHKNTQKTPENEKRILSADKLLNPAFIPYYLSTICLFLGLGSILAELYKIKQENILYQNEIQKIYKEAAPDAPYFQNFRQLKSVILNKISPENNAQPTNNILTALELLSSLFPDNQKIIVKTFTLNKNTVSLNAGTTNYEELDNIKKSLEASELVSEVKIANTSINPNNTFNINFEITFTIAE